LPNWATIVYGSGVVFHGVEQNGWQYCNLPKVDSFAGQCVIYPDIFTTIKKKKRMKTAFYYSWGELETILPIAQIPIDERLYEEAALCAPTIEASIKITNAAADYIVSEKPNYLFLYLDEVDECSHEFSCFSNKGQSSIRSADSNIGKIFNAVKEAGILEKTLFLFVTDHGREESGYSHESFTTSNINTQFVAFGAGIQTGEGRQLNSAISLEDISPTIAFALGIDAPVEWHGKPIFEVFRSSKMSNWFESQNTSLYEKCHTTQCKSPSVFLTYFSLTIIAVVTLVVCALGIAFYRLRGSKRHLYQPVIE